MLVKNLSLRVERAIEFALIVLLGIYLPLAAQAEQAFELRTISSRPETVSGGDVLVQVIAPAHSHWRVELNGRDVTTSFRPAENFTGQIGLVGGLRLNENTLQLVSNHKVKSTLRVVNHPRSGPIFSGPHQQPFICQTLDSGLGPPLDADCSAHTLVEYYYKSTEPENESSAQAGSVAPVFKQYDPNSGSLPADVAQTVTSEGRTVNFIVRRERGTINRGIYIIEFLHQPGLPLPTPWTRGSGWNGRLVYLFGPGCGAGYHQAVSGKPTSTSQSGPASVALGYAIATSTLNIFDVSCNDRVSAESLSMVKEHFIKNYGKPVHTIGYGGSGGAIQLHLIAQNYPGLIDGIIVGGSFPDILTYVPSVVDCSLLHHAFKTSKERWTEEAKTAVSGYATWRTCKEWAALDPKNCDSSMPKEMIYDRVRNPQGARCDFYSSQVNVLGRNPETGLVRRPLDNVGVQYGLLAFNSGKIDAGQFIDLNERIGGYDDDGNMLPARMEADREALRIAYKSGLVLTGGGGLNSVPILDLHPYRDDQGDLHVYLRRFQTRSRLIAANGNADNQVILVSPAAPLKELGASDPNSEEFMQLGRNVFRKMDLWLGNIALDSTAGTILEKMVRNRPPELSEGCWQADGKRIVERITYDGPGKCNAAYPPYADPRLAAGAPLSGDVLKCALKPVDPADYAHPLTSDQLARLKSIFPSGVCDYTRPGIGQQITSRVWQQY